MQHNQPKDSFIVENFDSIKNIEEKIDAMCKYCLFNRTSQPDKCLKIAKEAHNLAKVNNYKIGIGTSLLQIGFQHWHLSDIDNALMEVEEGIDILEKQKAYSELGDANMVKAMIIWSKGEYNSAFLIIYSALNLLEKHQVKVGHEWLYWSLGVFYYDLKDYSKSLKHYKKTLEIYKKLNLSNKGFFSYILIGLGCVYKSQQKFDEAINYLQIALESSREGGHWMEEARSYYELGLIYQHQGNLEKAEQFILNSYHMRKSHNTKPSMVSSLMALSDLKLVANQAKEAQVFMNEALEYAIETNSKPKIFQCYQKLSNISKSVGDFKSAYDFLDKFHTIKSEVIGEEANNTLKDLESKHASEKAEKEKEIEQLKNIELKKAHQEIVEKNKEILDSIAYAERIQKAILPPNNVIKEHLQNSFILYKPKDIVAGDFYWMECVEKKVIFAAADCTGHGVPGAMVSVVCNNALNRSVREHGLTSPGKILNKTREIVVQEFEKSEEVVKDGMDIALCSLEVNKLQYAGAHNPLWIIRKGEILETKANKQPIGQFDNPEPYTTHSFDLQKGDSIYIFSDGYVDQFGGEKGKKFKAKAFRELLLSIQNKVMEEQKTIIDEAFEKWRGSLEQIDDVCIIGVRI
jgi:serine phosphatase RsbU (regulator of sigma subunit)